MAKNKLKCGKCKKVTVPKKVCNFFQCECGANNIVLENSRQYTLKEWLNFNFKEYLRTILEIIDTDNFEMIKAKTQDEIKAGKFTDIEIEKLREVMGEGFSKELSINELSDRITKKVKPRDLFKVKDGKFALNKNGDKILQIGSSVRSNMIARTESTRLASLGVIEHYKDKGVTEITWVASLGDRTCVLCMELDGRVFDINQAPPQPVHVYCRCTYLNVLT